MSKYNRDLWYQKNYGITLNDYERILAEQNGRCALCGKTEGSCHNITKEPKRLSVDHDHKRGYVRGLLCDKCNRGLGYFKDKPELLCKASDYLLMHRLKNLI